MELSESKERSGVLIRSLFLLKEPRGVGAWLLGEQGRQVCVGLFAKQSFRDRLRRAEQAGVEGKM